jgi:sarcosine oxidase subunit alpha
MSGHRLASGGRIDRARPLRFTFGGRAYAGFAGDTLASALLANGVDIVARSFKYHRPRGIMSAGTEETALIQLETGARSTPNLRPTEIELYDGLVARGVNAWPSLSFDIGVLTSLASPLFVAGFYYKTFMRPKWLWDRVLEPAIRRMAGMGTAPQEPDPDRYDTMHAHCDVLVVGGGPAGLAAALVAARTGARVILCDERPALGGTLLDTRDQVGGADQVGSAPALDWVAEAERELRARPDVTVLPRTTVFGYYDHNYLCALERRTDHVSLAERHPAATRQRLWHIRAREVVLATGAHERPLVFAGNDRPGVMLAGAARAYVNRFAVAPGRRAVVFTNNDSAYAVVADLAAAGVTVAAVVDARPMLRPELAALVASHGARLHAGGAVVAVDGRRVQGVRVAPLDAAGTGLAGPAVLIDCDLVAMSGGWNPAVHLFSQAQGRLRWDDRLSAFLPGVAAQRSAVAGALAGAFDLAACLAGGAAAGGAAVMRIGFGDRTTPPMPASEPAADAPPRALWLVPGAVRKAFVDFQNDVTAADIQLAAREGLRSVEHVKRYTTTGMGTDQGKTANVNALAILSDAVGQRIVETGTTTFRPPYTPVAYGAMAGSDRELSDPVRVTPIHAWHVANGAVFEDVGQWKRPRFYPRPGEDMDAAVARECRAAREGVAALDASTLGKIDIRGPDAAEFLERVYTNAWKKLPVGSCRYGLMCKLDGMVFDDGVTARLAPDHFLMSTTTGNAARVIDWLEEWLQTEWPTLRVYCTSVTEQWATVAVVGPQARAVVAAVAPDLDVSAAAFPHMTIRETAIGGVAARIARVSFTGELSFEVSVPGRHGLALWARVMEAGARHGITPYGTEAMHVLRAEKGYIIVGQETDGTVTPFDLGMGWIVAKAKPYFIGKRSLARADAQRADRKQLVGLLPEDPALVVPEGIQLVAPENASAVAARRFPVPMEGHVTSSYRSAALGRSFALALVARGRARIGETVLVPLLSGAVAKATIVKPVFYDPEDARRDG